MPIDYEAAYHDLRAAVIEYRDALNQTTHPTNQQIARRSARIVAAETHLFRLVADAKARAYVYDPEESSAQIVAAKEKFLREAWFADALPERDG